MTKAKMVKELTFDMADRPGLLTEVSGALSDAGVNVQYLCAWTQDARANFMVISENIQKAKKAILSHMDIAPKEEDIILVELAGKTSSIRDMAASISEAGINMGFADFFVQGRNAMCVLSTSDDKKAVKLINKPAPRKTAAAIASARTHGW